MNENKEAAPTRKSLSALLIQTYDINSAPDETKLIKMSMDVGTRILSLILLPPWKGPEDPMLSFITDQKEILLASILQYTSLLLRVWEMKTERE